MAAFANTCGKTLYQSGTISEIQYGLANYGISTTHIPQNSNFTTNTMFAKLKAEIDAGDPIVADVTSHAVVIRGYSGSYLSIMDPMYTTYTQILHSAFYSASNSDNPYGYAFNQCLFT